MDCPFCDLDQHGIVLENGLAIAFYDRFPIAKGHSLVIPKRHVSSLFDTTAMEQKAMLSLLGKMHEHLKRTYFPDGFNIGINDGSAAGQTIMHLHIHLIPRYSGDQLDPRGGVRWVLPDKAAYWS